MASFATQVQIRRGTDAENDAFTGAEGEVTMDLTNKQLRVHDGQTKGGMKIPNIKTVFGTNQIANGAVTPEKLIGQPTFAGNAGKTLAVNQAGNGFEFIESTLPENSDYVVESQEPTEANGYTWYRKYRSGWVEQGGTLSAQQTVTATLPIEMSDNNYQVLLTGGPFSKTAEDIRERYVQTRTTTSFTASSLSSIAYMWQVSGQAA